MEIVAKNIISPTLGFFYRQNLRKLIEITLGIAHRAEAPIFTPPGCKDGEASE